MGFISVAGVFAHGQRPNSPDPNLPRIATHNNTVPAGVLHDGVLDLNLDIVKGEWYPEAEDGPHVAVYAFAEKGKAPSIPGPLIRVPAGTQIKLRVHNSLAAPVNLHGFNQRPGKDEAVTVAPTGERELNFAAGAPGTYFYWASSPDDSSLAGLQAKTPLDPRPSQLTGAFMVDDTGKVEADRVFVIGMWTQIDDPKSVKDFREFGVINGKSWPYGERLHYQVGDTVHMRWINASASNHPMHMHGSYYRLDGTSDGENENSLPLEQRPMIVTRYMPVRTAMEMTWRPDQPGHWLFHCHILAHIVDGVTAHSGTIDAATSDEPMHHEHGALMVGLVVGLDVDGTPVSKHTDYNHARKLTLAIQETNANPIQVHAQLREGSQTAESSGLMGPPIVLHRGEPVEITLNNQMQQETAIHWHGMELESYYDGVPEFSGMGSQITPAIPAGGKFVVRFTPPRAGTFIYHTHWHDVAQLSGGLYGPLIVLEPGQAYDPSTDVVFVAGGDNQSMFINGRDEGTPLRWRAGRQYHIRLIDISVNTNALFSLSSSQGPLQWRAVGKDGMKLPSAQQTVGDSKQRLSVGETYDFEFTAPAGDLVLSASHPGLSNLIAEKTINTPIHVE